MTKDVYGGLFHIPVIEECYADICSLLNRTNVRWEQTDEPGRINVVVPWNEAKKIDAWLTATENDAPIV